MTLVELLVAMIILSLLMTLVAQAVHQVSLISRATQRASTELRERWSGGWSVSDLLANLVIPPRKEDTPPMTGDPKLIQGFSTRPLQDEGTGLAAFELILEPAAPGLASLGDGRRPTVMRYRKGEAKALFAERTGRGNASEVVAQFPEAVEFVYTDALGRTLQQWPRTKTIAHEGEALPRSILVRSQASGRVLMTYAFTGENLRSAPAGKPFWEQ